MTGAVIPEWAQAVVPVELVTRTPESGVSFSQMPSAGEHIRRAGQDFKSGDPVLRAGTPIGPQHLMALAALGIERFSVYRRPKACFFATGHELAPASEKPLTAGRIYDSNSAYGMAALAAMGVDCTVSRTIPDDESVFLRAVSDALNAGHDMIVSSGGVSAGQFDFVRAALEKLGAVILFHKVAIKPGKPILCARFPDGCFYFGLPGNPASMTAGLRFFVQPFLDAWRRMPEEHPTAAVLESTFRKNNKMAVFLKAHVRADINGSLRASILNGQESFMISPFLSMNAWAIIGENTQEAGKGTLVDIYPLFQKDFCF